LSEGEWLAVDRLRGLVFPLERDGLAVTADACEAMVGFAGMRRLSEFGGIG
jgi:hypothetical protein